MTPKLGRPLESAVQRACLMAMAARGAIPWRNNSRVFRVPGKGGRERLMWAGAGRGTSDLMGVLPGGRHVCCEVKRPGEKPEPEQYDWLEIMHRQGAVAFWADDARTVDLILERVLQPDGHRVKIGIDRGTGEQWFEVEGE